MCLDEPVKVMLSKKFWAALNCHLTEPMVVELSVAPVVVLVAAAWFLLR